MRSRYVRDETLQECTEQDALERQDLSCTYLAHHKLETVFVVVIIITVFFPFL